jgi:hypothetical protein
MDVSTEELNMNCHGQDFEHVYIKQEEQVTPPSAFMTMKSEDKVKYIFLLHWCLPHFSRTVHVSFSYISKS